MGVLQVTDMKFHDLKHMCFERNLMAKTKREMQTSLRSSFLQDLADRILDRQEVEARQQQVLMQLHCKARQTCADCRKRVVAAVVVPHRLPAYCHAKNSFLPMVSAYTYT